MSRADINIAEHSSIYSSPYIGASLQYLVDGKIDDEEAINRNNHLTSTPLTIQHSSKIKLGLQFRFDAAQTINKIRLYQVNTKNRNYAKAYSITYLDPINTNNIKQAVDERNGKTHAWFEYRFTPPIHTKEIHFTTTTLSDNKGPSYGGPGISEFEIYANEYQQDTHEPALNNSDAIPFLKPDLNKSINIAENIRIDTPWRQRFQKGLFASSWFFENKKLEKYIPLLKTLDVTRLWLYPGLYKEHDDKNITFPASKVYKAAKNISHKTLQKDIRVVPFKNPYIPYLNTNFFATFINQLHDNNIGIIANEPFIPFGTTGWDFPRVFSPDNFPCILTSPLLHNIAEDYYDAILQTGIDGISIGGDEFFFYGHKAHDVTHSKFCDQPGISSDCNSSCFYNQKNAIEAQTTQKEDEYQQLSNLMRRLSSNIKQQGKISTSLFLTGSYNRPAYGIAQDIIGHHAGLDEITIDPYWSHNNYLTTTYFSAEIKKTLAATPQRTAHITLQSTPFFDSKPFEDDIMIYGPAIAAIMHGASGINIYKIDHMLNKGLLTPTYHRVRKLFNFINFLEVNGFLEFKIQKNIALLYSRSSEDNWQLEHKQDSSQAAEATLLQNAIIEILIKNSIPFDIYYLEQPESIPDLNNYNLTLLPLPHSIDQASLDKLKLTKKILAYQAKNESDMSNNINNNWIAELANIQKYDIALNKTNYQEITVNLINKITSYTKPHTSLTINNSNNTECSALEKNHDLLVYCINWSDLDENIVFNMGINESNYDIWSINPDHISFANIQKPLIPINHESGFKIKINAKSFQTYYFDEKPQSGKHNWNFLLN
ncbi:MAG: discoidin domain-containing protein [Gammaproteobacteria bacterium]|nr:discoidin domain-containing protein [Gammaproteobacteria bacterium]